MNWFDAIGYCVVASWLGLVVAYVYHHEAGSPPTEEPIRESVSLSEGTEWMILRRGGEDTGYLEQTRTRLPEGWLVEYELLMMLEVLDREVPLEASVRAELDGEGRLREFDGSFEGAGSSVSARGTVREGRLSLVVRSGDQPSRRELDLDRPPRLRTNAVQTLLTRPDLEVGDRVERRYFDPTRLGMRSVALEYRGRSRIETPAGERRAHHVRQRIDGSDYDVYVDDEGRMLRQSFPMGISAVRVPKEAGASRIDAVRSRAEEARRTFTAGERTDRGIRTVLRLLGFSELSPDDGAEGAAPPDAGDSGTVPSREAP